MARLGKDDWVTAGFAALREQGPDAVAVQPVAARLGATKGSFYWHFTTRDELLDAVLERWLEESTERVIADLERKHGEATPVVRFERLFDAVARAGERTPGEQRILAAAGHPAVGRAVRAAVERRIAYVAALLEQAGLDPDEARRRARLAYMMYLGHAQLVAIAPGEMAADQARQTRVDAVRMLLGDLVA
jgi:AcrR family transcriptional regulator